MASRYPWGREASCEHAILDDGVMRGSAGDEFVGCGEDRAWPVVSHAAIAFGLYDMHGNVGEWLHNGYTPAALAALYPPGALRSPDFSVRRLVRGGSWDENGSNLGSSCRNVKSPISGRAVYRLYRISLCGGVTTWPATGGTRLRPASSPGRALPSVPTGRQPDQSVKWPICIRWASMSSISRDPEMTTSGSGMKSSSVSRFS